MKNVTISLSEDLVHVRDNICKDCDLSRYAFAKEALLEKIERHSKTEAQEEVQENPEDQKKNSGDIWRTLMLLVEVSRTCARAERKG